MPAVVDWQHVADPQAAVEEAVRRLQAGQVLAFPTDTRPCLAASGLIETAVARLLGPLHLAVRGMAEARDWAPGMSQIGQRLARRFWPGPLTLLCRDELELGLLSRLAEPVRQRVWSDGAVSLRSPGHEVVLEVLNLLPGPLLIAPAGETGAADLVFEDHAVIPGNDATVVELSDSSWSIIQKGAISEEALRQQSTCLVVFVCTGNTCRSPLAEVLCKKRLSERLGFPPDELTQRGFSIISAGLAAPLGGRAAGEAQDVAVEYGADLTGHRTRPLTPELAAQADCLVAMTRGHVQALNNHFARLGSRPRLLSPQGDDIADPIGQTVDIYQVCGRQIWQALEVLVAELCPDTRKEPAGRNG
jgi:protein-tyrosine-phosphatase/tRNA A37 threonylcarbamoyladenosine synthetase subunit TsaC/SUA5/YrdC